MTINQDKELEELFESLPDAMVSRLISPDMVVKVNRIGELHGLAADQIEVLQAIMALTFFGKLSFDDIDQEIEEDIIADDTQLAGIKKDIEDQIIIPFIDELKNEDTEKSEDAAHPDRPTSRKPEDTDAEENAEIEKIIASAPNPVTPSAEIPTPLSAEIPSPATAEIKNMPAEPVHAPIPAEEAAMMPMVVPQNIDELLPLVIASETVHPHTISAPEPAPEASPAPVVAAISPVISPIAPKPAQASTIADSRLKNSASLPKEKIEFAPEPQDTKSKSENQALRKELGRMLESMVIKDAPAQEGKPQPENQAPKEKPYDGIDPYREPTA